MAKRQPPRIRLLAWAASLILTVTCHAGEAACGGGDAATGAGCACACGEACCGTCDECLACDPECQRLLGLIAASDWCFSDFISPMTNPVFFEDPRTLTEARLIYIHHKTPPGLLPGLGSDQVELVAVQLRAALTERLSFIATKDGYIMSDSPLIEDGWADVSVGIKYNLLRDVEMQRLVSAGATFELPVGSTRSLQGNGDGEFHAFITGGTQLGADYHLISAAGIRMPTDTSAENQLLYWSNHIDRRLFWDDVYVLAEANWYHYLESGTALPVPLEGGDLFNLGAVDVAGNNLVTGAFGFKYAPQHLMELGVAWELPLTEREGLLDNRLTVDCILRY